MTMGLHNYLRRSWKNTHGICSNFHPEMGKDYSQATQVKVMMKSEVKLGFVVLYEVS